MGYLVDSNVLIDYVAERFKQEQLRSLDLIFDDAIRISVITKIEILGYSGEPDEETKMIQFLDQSDIIMLTEEVVERTILLKKAHQNKNTGCNNRATALVNGHTLITNNTSDFKRIEDLKLFNPYNL